MKKLLLIGLMGLMLAGCPEQGTTDGSSNAANPISPTSPVPIDLPYDATLVLPFTSLPALSSTTYYSAAVIGTVSYVTGANSASYSSTQFGSQVSTASKFKIKGDSQGAFTMAADLVFPANQQFLMEAVRANFGVSTSPAFVQISLTALNSNQLVYRLTFADENQASNDIVFDYPLYSNGASHIIPVSISRDATGTVTVTVDGHANTFSQASLAQDADMGSTVYGNATGSIQNLTLTPSILTQWQGR